MRAWVQVGLLALLAGALSALGQGQSVAEAAKQQQQQKQQAQPQKAKPDRVYTNDDFPSRAPEAEEEGAEAAPAKPAVLDSKQPSPEEVRAAALAQKQKIRALDARVADLQRQMDQWSNANLGSWCPAYGYYYNPYQGWCETPQFLLIELERAKQQRAEAQGQLDLIQEQARRLGYRSVVYDPD